MTRWLGRETGEGNLNVEKPGIILSENFLSLFFYYKLMYTCGKFGNCRNEF